MREEDQVSKKTLVTLPDAVYDELKEWADQQGRPLANLCSYLLEKSLEQAKKDKDFEPLSSSDKK